MKLARSKFVSSRVNNHVLPFHFAFLPLLLLDTITTMAAINNYNALCTPLVGASESEGRAPLIAENTEEQSEDGETVTGEISITAPPIKKRQGPVGSQEKAKRKAYIRVALTDEQKAVKAAKEKKAATEKAARKKAAKEATANALPTPTAKPKSPPFKEDTIAAK